MQFLLHFFKYWQIFHFRFLEWRKCTTCRKTRGFSFQNDRYEPSGQIYLEGCFVKKYGCTTFPVTVAPVQKSKIFSPALLPASHPAHFAWRLTDLVWLQLYCRLADSYHFSPCWQLLICGFLSRFCLSSFFASFSLISTTNAYTRRTANLQLYFSEINPTDIRHDCSTETSKLLVIIRPVTKGTVGEVRPLEKSSPLLEKRYNMCKVILYA